MNGGTYYGGASLYKLTEMMGLARMVSAGEYAQEDKIQGMTISYIEKRALVYSDNNVGESILMWYQTQLPLLFIAPACPHFRRVLPGGYSPDP